MNRLTPLIIFIVISLAIIIGQSIGSNSFLWKYFVMFGVFAGLSLIILNNAWVGLLLIFGSLPLVELLPSLPLVTSAFPLIGGVTLVSYVFKTRPVNSGAFLFRFNRIHIAALAFIMWIFISNPAAAMIPDTEQRIWMITYIQLFIMLGLISELATTETQYQTLMKVFIAAAVISALFVLWQTVLSGNPFTVRARGATGGANTEARYLLLAIVFLYYLLTISKDAAKRSIIAMLLGFMLVATIFTLSRTGILLIGLAAILLLPYSFSTKHASSYIGFLLVVVVVAVFFIPSEIMQVIESIPNSARQGRDTAGLRYRLWHAGYDMWRDHPIAGVGIGRYNETLPDYGVYLLAKYPKYYLNLGAHNTYVQVLAETGIVGLVLFMILILSALRSLWVASRTLEKDMAKLASIWFVALFVILIGGITKQDEYYSKLFWIILGAAASFQSVVQTRRSVSTNPSSHRLKSGSILSIGGRSGD